MSRFLWFTVYKTD